MSRLEKARSVAEEFSEKYKKDALGIIFQGALARDYFDKFADIDIIVIGKKKLQMVPSVPRNAKYKGFVIDYWTTSLKELKKKEWSMSMRWSLSEAIVYHDTNGIIKKLLKERAKFLKGERRWLMIEGTIQSEWFCNSMPELWVSRGDIVSAHAVFDKGMQHFYEALFAFNNCLVPYEKWRINYARKLPWVPKKFDEKLKEIYLVKSLSKKELERRKNAFMYIWNQFAPKIEKEVKLTIKEMDKMV